ncbi:hypothetical protein RRG08_024009 [Elysia crispata]|uniref:Uncharacterized protein n=1 Tax=Elysia crispata TaxID=231223 RepID=A0AAE0YMJ2_9GAST|nr:hypothetical protein RRG08_024009 [Elysia crispata]
MLAFGNAVPPPSVEMGSLIQPETNNLQNPSRIRNPIPEAVADAAWAGAGAPYADLSSLQEPISIRSDFSETWLFLDSRIG